MKRVNVIHRDIRPSKVFFVPVVFGNDRGEMYSVSDMGGHKRINTNKYNYSNNSRFYNLMNL